MKGCRKMKRGKRKLLLGMTLLVAFVIWTALILTVDVQPWGQNGTNIGFATLNCWFHQLTGVHMGIYVITDWLGLVPIFVCMLFGCIGFVQLLRRRSLFIVDYDILILGIYYIVVIFGYLVFEMIPINYRPILIEDVMEVSYPSSTTLLVLSVMPTVIEQTGRRVQNAVVQRAIRIVVILFSSFMVIGRLISGVHWVTDIVGGVLLSAGLFFIYEAFVVFDGQRQEF
jgi:undecaprenyl-diphosphatase